MQSFIGSSIQLGRRQGFKTTVTYLATNNSNSISHGSKSSVLSSNNQILKPLQERLESETNKFMFPMLGLSRLSAMMYASSSRCMTTAASAIPDSSESDGPESFADVPRRIKFKRLDKTARNIMQIVDKEAVQEVKAQREIPDIKPGYIVQLRVEVPENKRRISTIKGIVIARRNAGLNTTFRIRRMVAGIGVESLFPLYSPNIKEIKVLDKKNVRRAKLYYLRDKMNALR